ncbi:MAG: hypothetical protein N2B06_02405 [Clostridium sp.]
MKQEKKDDEIQQFIIESSECCIDFQNTNDIGKMIDLYKQFTKKYFPLLYDEVRFKNTSIITIFCTQCKTDKHCVIDWKTSTFICKNCGEDYKYNITTDCEYKQKGQYTYKSPSRYKRVDTFQSALDNFLGKNAKNLPINVLQEIIDKVKDVPKYRITLLGVRKLLKSMNYRIYYQYTNYIYYNIVGYVPEISEESEKELHQLFYCINDSFNRLKMTNTIKRKKIWIYKFIIYKELQLLHLDDLIQFIQKPLINNEYDSNVYDMEFKLIMQDLNLPFYPTINI